MAAANDVILVSDTIQLDILDEQTVVTLENDVIKVNVDSKEPEIYVSDKYQIFPTYSYRKTDFTIPQYILDGISINATALRNELLDALAGEKVAIIDEMYYNLEAEGGSIRQQLIDLDAKYLSTGAANEYALISELTNQVVAQEYLIDRWTQSYIQDRDPWDQANDDYLTLRWAQTDAATADLLYPLSGLTGVPIVDGGGGKVYRYLTSITSQDIYDNSVRVQNSMASFTSELLVFADNQSAYAGELTNLNASVDGVTVDLDTLDGVVAGKFSIWDDTNPFWDNGIDLPGTQTPPIGVIKFSDILDGTGINDYLSNIQWQFLGGAIGPNNNGWVRTDYSVAESLAAFDVTVVNSLSALQSQIDGEISNWFYTGAPGDLVEPESLWIAEDIANGNDIVKTNHIGDLYYDGVTGTAYRYTNAFSWIVVTDTAVTLALANAASAQDAADRLIKTFYAVNASPPTADGVGDLWVVSNVYYDSPDNTRNMVRRWSSAGIWVDLNESTDKDASFGWAAGASKLIKDPATGGVTGWSFADGSNVSSEFKINANKFIIASSDGSHQPLTIDAVTGQSVFNGIVNFTNTDMDPYSNDLVPYRASLGVKVNYTTFTTPDTGELYIHGFTADGTAADQNGDIVHGSQTLTIPKGRVYTGLANKSGYLVYKTNGNFVLSTTDQPRAFCYFDVEAYEWKYDDNSTDITFIPDGNYIIIGECTTGISDNVVSASMYQNSISFESARLSTIANTKDTYYATLHDKLDYATTAELHDRWFLAKPDGVFDSSANNFGDGGRCIRSSSSTSAWILSRNRMKIDRNRLYKLSVHARHDTGTTGIAFIGLVCYDKNGIKLNRDGIDSYNSSHYVALGGSLTTGWQEFVGYFQGQSFSPNPNATPDPDNPTTLYEGTVEVAPLLIANYENLAGTMYFDEVKIESVEEKAGSGINIVPAIYSDFESNEVPLCYHDEIVGVNGGTALILIPDDGYHVIGTQSLRIQSQVPNGWVNFGYFNTDAGIPFYELFNITMAPGKKWIMSVYLRLHTNGSPITTDNVELHFTTRSGSGDTGTTHYNYHNISVPADGSMHRYSVAFDFSDPSHISYADSRGVVRVDNDSFNNLGSTLLYVDGIMLEEQIGLLSNPSEYSPGVVNSKTSAEIINRNLTTIDGGKLTTDTAWINGHVQSSDFSTIGGAGFRLKSNAAGTSADPTIYGAYVRAGILESSYLKTDALKVWCSDNGLTPRSGPFSIIEGQEFVGSTLTLLLLHTTIYGPNYSVGYYHRRVPSYATLFSFFFTQVSGDGNTRVRLQYQYDGGVWSDAHDLTVTPTVVTLFKTFTTKATAWSYVKFRWNVTGVYTNGASSLMIAMND